MPVLGTCEVPVRFSPYAVGARNATLEIRYTVATGPTSPLTVSPSSFVLPWQVAVAGRPEAKLVSARPCRYA